MRFVKCYGLNLATNRNTNLDSIGIMAAQSIGEPGTQLTLRTFHIGGTASRIVEQSHMDTKRDGIVKFSDNLKLVKVKDEEGNTYNVATIRNGKMN